MDTASIIAGVIKGVADPLSDSINSGFDRLEQEKDRQFTREMLEVELYKNGYASEIKEVFDYWSKVLEVTHIKDNKNLNKQEKNKCDNEYKQLVNVRKTAEMNMKTLKYAGENTIFALNMVNIIRNYYNEEAEKGYTLLYAYARLFSSLKKDILNIDMAPEHFLVLLTNDILMEDEYKKLSSAKITYEDYLKDFKDRIK